MEIKKVMLEISNKAKKKDKDLKYAMLCRHFYLPSPEESRVYECQVKIYNNTKLTKSLIINTLKNGEIRIDDVIYIKCVYLQNILWTKSESCFKFNVLSISDC